MAKEFSSALLTSQHLLKRYKCDCYDYDSKEKKNARGFFLLE
jgi:hypothetical protein